MKKNIHLKSKLIISISLASVALMLLVAHSVLAGWNYYDYDIPYTVASQTVTVTVTSDASSISYGGSTTIRWTSTNATSCDTGGHGTATEGSFSTGALTGDTKFTITCTN